MITMKLDAAKQMFFDREKVERAADRGLKRGFSKIGAYVRQRAKSSIRKRKAISEPGSPPSSHTDLIRRMIYFVWDAQRKSVVIGPVLLNRGDGGALDRLEHGGEATKREVHRTRTLFYRPRPFMQPALDKELEKLPASLTDCITANGA